MGETEEGLEALKIEGAWPSGTGPTCYPAYLELRQEVDKLKTCLGYSVSSSLACVI